MKFYRYDLHYHDRYTKLDLTEYFLVKETKCGYWIAHGSPTGFHTPKRWIAKGARQSFAYPTKELALNSFIIRKKKQIQYCQRDIRYATTGLELANKERLNLL